MFSKAGLRFSKQKVKIHEVFEGQNFFQGKSIGYKVISLYQFLLSTEQWALENYTGRKNFILTTSVKSRSSIRNQVLCVAVRERSEHKQRQTIKPVFAFTKLIDSEIFHVLLTAFLDSRERSECVVFTKFILETFRSWRNCCKDFTSCTSTTWCVYFCTNEIIQGKGSMGSSGTWYWAA